MEILKKRTRPVRRKYEGVYPGIDKVLLQTGIVAPLDATIDLRIVEINKARAEKGLLAINKQWFVNIALANFDERTLELFNENLKEEKQKDELTS